MDVHTKKPDCPTTFPNTPTQAVIQIEEICKCPYPDCDYESKWKRSVVQHEKRHTSSTSWDLSCRFCLQNYHSLVSFLHHMSSRHSNELSCPLCPFVGQKLCEFKAHLLTHRASERNELACPLPDCAYTARRPAFLQSHMKIRHEIHPGIEVTIQEKQDQGSKGKHTEGGKALWDCDKRSCNTSLPQDVRMHTCNQSCEKPFKCPNQGCYYRGRSAKGLQIHQRSCPLGRKMRSLKEIIFENRKVNERSCVNWKKISSGVEASTAAEECKNTTEVNVHSSHSLGFACMVCHFIGDSEFSALQHARKHKETVVITLE